jgi:hypothetical protein
LSAAKSGHRVEAVEQEAGMPPSVRVQASISAGIGSNPPPGNAHLGIVWWHQRAGEPDEFMQIAYDTSIDAGFRELDIPFSSLALPEEENLICFRDCRDRALCSCYGEIQFALASIVVAIDQDGDGSLSLDEIRAEQIAGSPAVIGWAPKATAPFDVGMLDSIHQGFAVYAPLLTLAAGQPLDGLAPLEAVTTSMAPAMTLSFCAPSDLSCSLPIQYLYCHPPICDETVGTDQFGLNRLGL